MRQLVTDRASRYVFTGAGDETVRIWDALAGTPVQTVRWPCRGSGPVEAFAVAPDGLLLAAVRHAAAVGSAEAEDVIAFVRWRSGQVLRQVRGLPA